MGKKFFIAIFLTVFIFIVLPFDINTEAKRLLPQSQSPKVTPSKTTKGVTVNVKFRSDRNAIIATFTNLKIAKQVGYTLTYKASLESEDSKNSDNIEQVAQSSIDVKAQEPVVLELPFGTCSTDNVCRYDTDIHDAKFIVTTTLTSGKKVVKTFNLKIKK